MKMFPLAKGQRARGTALPVLLFAAAVLASEPFGRQEGAPTALVDGGAQPQCMYSERYVRQWFSKTAPALSRERIRTYYDKHIARFRKRDVLFMYVTVRDNKVRIEPECGAGKRFRCLCEPPCAQYPSLNGGGVPMPIFEGRLMAFVQVLDATTQLGVPDVEFILNVDDHPRSRDPHVPVLSACADTCKVDIPIPLELPGFAGGWHWLKASAAAAALASRKELPPWLARKPTLFWRSTARLPQRGSCMWLCNAVGNVCAGTSACSGAHGKQCYGEKWQMSPRARVAALGKRHPDLLDVSYSGHCCSAMLRDRDPPAYPHDLLKTEFGPAKHFATWQQMAKFKYLLALDGNSYATGYAGLLLLGSPVFRHESPFPLFFEGKIDPVLRDGTDFVRVAADLSDLPDKVSALKKDDVRARRIGEQGAATAVKAVGPEQSACYLRLVLREYALRLAGKGAKIQHEL